MRFFSSMTSRTYNLINMCTWENPKGFISFCSIDRHFDTKLQIRDIYIPRPSMLSSNKYWISRHRAFSGVFLLVVVLLSVCPELSTEPEKKHELSKCSMTFPPPFTFSQESHHPPPTNKPRNGKSTVAKEGSTESGKTIGKVEVMWTSVYL